ncbi:hypothetical protein SNEBB_004924 [Seison nebaliae]|nr:hypothetical protein SNEBB_004924 [Seison nebaliae]
MNLSNKFDFDTPDKTETFVKSPALNILRDPYEQPPYTLNNEIGVCFSITALQFFLSSPTLMTLLYNMNYCTEEACNVVNKLNSATTLNRKKFPANFEHVVFTHEVMAMMSFSSMNGSGLNCQNHTYSLGCRNATSDKLCQNGSIIFQYTYQLLAAKQREPNWMEKRRLSLSTRKEKFPRNPEISSPSASSLSGLWKELKNFMSCQMEKCYKNVFGEYEHLYRTMENFQIKYSIVPIISLFTDLLYLGEGATHEHEVVGIQFDNTDNAFKYFQNSLLRFPGKYDDEVGMYFPQTKVLIIHNNLVPQDDLVFPENLDLYTLDQFTRLPLPQDRLNVISPKFNENLERIFSLNGLPNVVIFEQLYNEYLSEKIPFLLSPSIFTMSDMLDQSSFVIEKLVENIELENIGDWNNYQDIFIDFFRTILPFPKAFWCEDEPCEQDLFQTTSNLNRPQKYTLYGIGLCNDDMTVELQNIEIPPNYLTNDTIIYINRRLRQLFNIFINHTKLAGKYEKLNSNQQELFRKPLESKLMEIVYNETLVKLQNIEVIKDEKYLINITHKNIIQNTGHVIGAFKSLDGNRWWLIDNDYIIEINNIREFFQLDPFISDNYICQTAWEITKNYVDLGQKLRQLINPIRRPTRQQFSL